MSNCIQQKIRSGALGPDPWLGMGGTPSAALEPAPRCMFC